MKLKTPYGQLHILTEEAIFKYTVDVFEKTVAAQKRPISIALTGGSTPKAFYQWITRNRALSESLLESIYWFTSDERCVPLSSDESNFGNADRLLLTPIRIPSKNRFPWPVELPPTLAADTFSKAWNKQFSPDMGFDICLLGMGDDCHTASLFPHSPLLGSSIRNSFAAVEVPGKGWRLTITESGLDRCGTILVTTLGSGKADALKSVLEGPFDIHKVPSQMHKNHAHKTTWLVDSAAAAKLSTHD